MYNNKTKKQIYLLFTCDEWCTKSTQRLIMATTSVEKLKTKIAQLITKGDFDYNNSEWDRNTQVKYFKKDFDTYTRTDINSLLKYGFIDYCYDGEEI